MKTLFLLCAVFMSAVACAGTVRLLNDSPFKLTAVIITANGQQTAEYTLNPQQTVSWIDYTNQPSDEVNLQPTWPDTPYTVVWYCQGGADYAVCSNVTTGGLATAQGGIGPKFCQPQRRKPGPQPASPSY